MRQNQSYALYRQLLNQSLGLSMHFFRSPQCNAALNHANAPSYPKVFVCLCDENLKSMPANSLWF